VGEITAPFLDVGGVLATNGWDRHADQVRLAMRSQFGGHSTRGDAG